MCAGAVEANRRPTQARTKRKSGSGEKVGSALRWEEAGSTAGGENGNGRRRYARKRAKDEEGGKKCWEAVGPLNLHSGSRQRGDGHGLGHDPIGNVGRRLGSTRRMLEEAEEEDGRVETGPEEEMEQDESESQHRQQLMVSAQSGSGEAARLLGCPAGEIGNLAGRRKIWSRVPPGLRSGQRERDAARRTTSSHQRRGYGGPRVPSNDEQADDEHKYNDGQTDERHAAALTSLGDSPAGESLSSSANDFCLGRSSNAVSTGDDGCDDRDREADLVPLSVGDEVGLDEEDDESSGRSRIEASLAIGTWSRVVRILHLPSALFSFKTGAEGRTWKQRCTRPPCPCAQRQTPLRAVSDLPRRQKSGPS